MDDFAWLGLKQEIATSGWRALFEPRAQGTVRLFSERLYFLLLSGIFGIHPLPFRVVAFAVQFVNLWLIVRLALRFTAGSLPAALAAGLFYGCSSALVRPLAWASSLNQILAAACMLAAFTCLLNWIDSGKPRWWWLQCGIFLFSFGVLESILVYPAIATLYCLLYARHRVRAILPLWIPSFAFAAVHLLLIRRPGNTPYSPVFDAGMLQSLAAYTSMALGPEGYSINLIIGLVMTATILWRAIRYRDFLPAFFFLWFLGFLTPVLPFQHQILEYYVVLPASGLALLLACVVAQLPAGTSRWVAAAAFAALYVWPAADAAHNNLDWFYERSERIRKLLDAGVQTARNKHIDTLLLSGVDTELFRTALQDSPFRLYGLTKVYLVPGSESSIHSRADLGGVSAYRISWPQAIQAIESGSTAVLSIAADEVHDVTARYRAVAINQYLQTRPRSVNVGEPGYDSILGPGWWPIEDKFRWMSKTASVRLGGPITAATRLHITGFCPETVSSKGPVTLTVRQGQTMLGEKILTKSEPFALSLPMQESSLEWQDIRLEVSRVTRLPGDKRDLGLIFGTFALKP
jgi:hypothetical protein